MSHRKLTPAEKCWLGLGVYVLAADIFLWRTENDTMSIQFSRWLQSPQGRSLCYLATGGMVMHLFWGLPLPLQTQAKKYLGGKR